MKDYKLITYAEKMCKELAKQYYPELFEDDFSINLIIHADNTFSMQYFSTQGMKRIGVFFRYYDKEKDVGTFEEKLGCCYININDNKIKDIDYC